MIYFRDTILAIGDTITPWLDIFTTRELVIMWLATSLVAYLLTRRANLIRKESWKYKDALFTIFISMLGGPLVMFVAAIFNLHSKLFFDWLDKPSRW